MDERDNQSDGRCQRSVEGHSPQHAGFSGSAAHPLEKDAHKPTREITIKIRVTTDEWTEIRDRACQQGMNMSRYLRQSALRQIRHAADREAISSFNRCATNVNQIAKRLNEARQLGSQEFADRVDQTLRLVRAIMSEIMEKLDEHTIRTARRE